MAKTTIRDSFNIQAQMQASLKEAGIENRAALDKLMSSTTIEKILSDAPAVYNYFKLANIGLWSMIEPKDLREVRGATPTPEEYRAYFDNQTPQPTPYFNFIPYQDFFDPQALGQKAGFKPEQTAALAMLQQEPAGSPASASWEDVEGQGGAPYGGPTGGAGKAMSTGTPYYGGGTGKAMGTGGAPQSKSLAPPPPPPGMGGAPGGFPPPPGPGGMGAGGGMPPGWDPSAGTQWARDYVDTYLANDPSYQGFQALFGRSDMTNNMIAGLMEEQAREDQIKQKILTELQTLDPRTPEGARRITMLNYEMQEISQSRSMRMDKMMTVKRYFNEFVSVFKDLMDIKNRSLDTISKNMRQ